MKKNFLDRMVFYISFFQLKKAFVRPPLDEYKAKCATKDSAEANNKG